VRREQGRGVGGVGGAGTTPRERLSDDARRLPTAADAVC